MFFSDLRDMFYPSMAANIFLGGFSSSSTTWFTSLVPTDHVSNVQQIIPITKSEISLDDSTASSEADSKVKTKLLSMWYNVKYGLCEQIY